MKMLNVTRESVTVQERLLAMESIVKVILSNDILGALTHSDIAGGNGRNGSSFSKHLVVDVFCQY